MALLGVAARVRPSSRFAPSRLRAGRAIARKPVIGERLNVFAGITIIALGVRVALPLAK
jgi:hypothetical protein